MVDTVKIRRPIFPGPAESPSGRVARDDRGNAIWQWATHADAHPIDLEMPALEIADEPALPTASAKLNRVGAKSGYNPYESGLIVEKNRPKRRDLRELSRWIEQQRKRAEATDED